MNVWTQALHLWTWVQQIYGTTLPAYNRSIGMAGVF